MDTEPISHEIVTQTWQRMSQLPPPRAPQIVRQYPLHRTARLEISLMAVT